MYGVCAVKNKNEAYPASQNVTNRYDGKAPDVPHASFDLLLLKLVALSYPLLQIFQKLAVQFLGHTIVELAAPRSESRDRLPQCC